MISKKALLIGGGVLGGLGILWYLSQSSSSSSSGTTSVDLTPPTLTLGPYPSQSPQTGTSPPAATGSNSGGCTAGQVSSPFGGCITPRGGFNRTTGSILSSAVSVSGWSPFPVGQPPGFEPSGPSYTNPVLPNYSGSTAPILNPSNPRIPYVVL